MLRQKRQRQKHITSFQIIILGFLFIIGLGSLLLMLPFATKSGKSPAFSDALFTATSAVCVTGLVVFDTATYWSAFGQMVILLLIQIGGMGIVTVAVSVATLSGRKIGLMQRSTMQESISAHHVGGIVRLTVLILKITASVELMGVAMLMPIFCKEFGFLKGLWYSVFHSISAFCNAGFDLMGTKGEFSSLTSYSSNPFLNIIIIILIVIGGVGFLTWEDIKNNKWKIRKYRMQSKVIILVTGVLIILPAIFFFFFEFSYLPLGERILCSFFHSVTPRTAGFNTVNMNILSDTGKTLTIVLMIIGGSPGSTAGGMKTTTVAVLFSTAISVFRKKESVQMFKRRIVPEAIRNACTVFLMYVSLFVLAGMIISRVENLPILTSLFETASAIGTVGLTLGITPHLSVISQLILIGLMFFGRAGGLTIVFAAHTGTVTNISKYPQEKITVG